MKFVVEVNGIEHTGIKGFEKFLSAIGFIIEGSIVEKITQLGLVKTGQFRAGIHTTQKGNEVTISDSVEYGKYLEWGTTTHFVRPTKKKALHWKQDGKDRFSKGHIVKGIKAYAPFRKGIVSAIPKIRRAFGG